MPNNILITPGSASIQFSGSAANTIRLQVEESGSVAFYGVSGSLFGITDQLSGSLMSVNDISGLPILEVFSDDRVVMGTFGRNTLVVSGSTVTISGSLLLSGSSNISGGGGSGAGFPFSGSAVITGSLRIFDNSGPSPRLTISGSNPHILLAGAFSNTSASSHSRVYFVDNNFGIGAGRWGASLEDGGLNDDLYIWAYSGSGRDIRFATTLDGTSAVDSANWTTHMIVRSNGRVGIGTIAPSASLQVRGNISASSYTSSITNGVGFLGSASYATNALTASFALNTGGSGAGFPFSGSAVITGSLLISGSSTSSIFDVYKSGSRVINIEGSQGQLFSVTDSLSGSLMSVNDITGLPILEVFSDDRVVMGPFGRNTLVVSGTSVVVSGSLTVTSGSLTVTNQLVLPRTGSISPQTGSMFFSGSFIYVYDGTQYRSASLN